MKSSAAGSTLSITVLRPVVASLQAMGLDWRAMLRGVGIDPDRLSDSTARIPHQQFFDFWPHAAAHTGDPLFGLHLAMQAQPRAVNLLGYLLLSSHTLWQGVQRIARYQSLVVGTQVLQLTSEGSSAFIRMDSFDSESLPDRHRIEYWALFALKWLSWVAGSELRPREVTFRHAAAGPLSEYQSMLGTRVRFDCDRSGLLMDRADLQRASLHANEELAKLHVRYAEEHLESYRDDGLVRQVNGVLMSRLELGAPRLSDVAQRLGTSPRTLQRRLADEGTSFHEVVARLRRQIALHYLERTDAPVTEIAYVAGFSEISSFTRAVRRWTGHTPSEHRRLRDAHQPGVLPV